MPGSTKNRDHNPEWEVNIEGQKYRGRWKTIHGAVQGALMQFLEIKNMWPPVHGGDGKKYDDLVIYVKRTQDPIVKSD